MSMQLFYTLPFSTFRVFSSFSQSYVIIVSKIFFLYLLYAFQQSIVDRPGALKQITSHQKSSFNPKKKFLLLSPKKFFLCPFERTDNLTHPKLLILKRFLVLARKKIKALYFRRALNTSAKLSKLIEAITIFP